MSSIKTQTLNFLHELLEQEESFMKGLEDELPRIRPELLQDIENCQCEIVDSKDRIDEITSSIKWIKTIKIINK